jgi:methylglyoxal synthase
MRPSETVRRLPAKKRIALVAHDHRKAALVRWVEQRRAQLADHELLGTGTTAGAIQRATGLPVRGLLSGPLGGDQQLGALIAEGSVDVMIFFWDPLESVPHDPDVKALLRLASVWNIPVACNSATADFLMDSPYMAADYDTEVPDLAAWTTARSGGTVPREG